MTEKSTSAIRTAVTAAVSLACMAPAMAINAAHRIGGAPNPGEMEYALAAASAASVLIAAASLHLSKDKTADVSLRAIAVAAFIVCTGYNLQCAIGVASTTRGDMTGSRKADIGKKQILEGQLAQAEASRKELAKVAGEDTAAMVDATLKSLRNDAKWSRSIRCEDATKDDTRAFCADYANKLKMQAAATRVEVLDTEILDLKNRLIAATGAGTGQPVDAQADNIATLLSMVGISAEAAKIGITLNFWFSLTLEVLGTAGPILLSATMFPTRNAGATVTRGGLVKPDQIDVDYELVTDSKLRGGLRADYEGETRNTRVTSQTRNSEITSQITSPLRARNARNALIKKDNANVVPLRADTPEDRAGLVMALRNQGKSNCEIARELNVSEGTVRLDLKKASARNDPKEKKATN